MLKSSGCYSIFLSSWKQHSTSQQQQNFIQLRFIHSYFFSGKLGLYTSFTSLKSIQCKFLRAIFHVAPCIPNIILRRDTKLSTQNRCIHLYHSTMVEVIILSPQVWVLPLLRAIINRYGSGLSYKNISISGFSMEAFQIMNYGIHSVLLNNVSKA